MSDMSSTFNRVHFGQELSKREAELAELVYQHKLNKEIAYETGLAVGTVKEYLHQIYIKTGVTNRTMLAVYWLKSHHKELLATQGGM